MIYSGDSKTADLFPALCARLRVQPDRRGECHVACPWCSKEVKRGQTHFSFSERGAFCHICGQGGSLKRLWDALFGDARPARYEPRPRRAPRRRYDLAAHRPDLWVGEYAAHPRRLELWWAYAPRLPRSVAEAYHLGVGKFPPYSSKCPHERLQVPLVSGGVVVGFRGRSLGCGCGKWLAPGGTVPVLYNGARVLRPEWRRHARAARMGDCASGRDARGRTVWVVENPVDALLVESVMDVPAVAILGASMWRDEWSRALLSSGASRVVVALDNDHAGNVTPAHAAQIGAAWREEHDADPPANGNRLVNRLLKAGVKARLFDWPEGTPLGTDMGDLLRNA